MENTNQTLEDLVPEILFKLQQRAMDEPYPTNGETTALINNIRAIIGDKTVESQ